MFNVVVSLVLENDATFPGVLKRQPPFKMLQAQLLPNTPP
jgi:hypothetical protein